MREDVAVRYFHRAWVDGELPDAESELVSEAYQARLADIRSRLTPELVTLAETDLNDALIEHIEWAPSIRRLVMELVVGSNQTGYSIKRLTFHGALIGERRRETLRDLGRDRRVEMLAHEVDIDEDDLHGGVSPDAASEIGFTLRMLFWPTHELTIDFATLEVETRPGRGRLISPGEAFVELDEDDLGDLVEIAQASS